MPRRLSEAVQLVTERVACKQNPKGCQLAKLGWGKDAPGEVPVSRETQAVKAGTVRHQMDALSCSVN